MKTYTQYVDTARGTVEMPHQAVAMFEVLMACTGIGDRPNVQVTGWSTEVSPKELAVRGGSHNAQQMSSALSILTNKGYLYRVKRGRYRLTRLGRQVWTRIFDRELGGTHVGS